MKITICGDVSPCFTNDLFLQEKKEVLFHDVVTEVSDTNRFLVNLECALTDSDDPISKIGPNLKCSPIVAKILKDIGVTDCCLANNHIFDYGVQGATDTISAVLNAGMQYTGFGQNYQESRKNLIIEKDGIRVAVIAVCEHEYCYALPDRMGARPFLPYDTILDIREAKQHNDHVIVIYHGGKEQCEYPSPRLRRQSQAFVEHGADVVLCQHSHCIGCYEQYENGHILYGQGNFHFVGFRDDHPHWQSGFIVHVLIDKELSLRFVPVVITGRGIALAQGEERTRILSRFEERSRHLHDGQWLQGWRDFCKSNIPLYHGIVGRAYATKSCDEANEFFAHYLYCEAHRDVLEELCKLSWETRLIP